jgi:hypothetical protein
MLRDVGYGPYFLTYEAISRGWPSTTSMSTREGEGLSWTRLLCAGGAAGVIGWGVT